MTKFLHYLILWNLISLSLEYDSTQDYLSERIALYGSVVIGLFVVQTITLILLGQPLISPTGLRIWWGDTNSPENSMHLSDWYTFTHILHGLIMYWIFFPLPSPITLNYAFLLGLGTAVTWEIVENTPCIINRYRKTAASAEYRGDSVVNSFCDSMAMCVGFWLAYAIPWWGTVALAILEEVVLGIVIRDNMVLNVVQIVFPFKCISDWQERGKRTRTETA